MSVIVKYNKVFFMLCCVFAMITMDGEAQDKRFSNYYHQRKTLFEQLPNTKGEIIFLGNSITDGGEWIELLNNKKVRNRGISGDITDGVLYRLDEVIESQPKIVFLLIGINDLARGIKSDTIVSHVQKIALRIKEQSPHTKVYIQSILPVNQVFKKFSGHCSKTDEIISINNALEVWCEGHTSHYLDLFSHFKNEEDNLMSTEYTNDGLHLTGAGYLLWADIIKPYIK